MASNSQYSFLTDDANELSSDADCVWCGCCAGSLPAAGPGYVVLRTACVPSVDSQHCEHVATPTHTNAVLHYRCFTDASPILSSHHERGAEAAGDIMLARARFASRLCLGFHMSNNIELKSACVDIVCGQVLCLRCSFETVSNAERERSSHLPAAPQTLGK